MFRRFWQWGHFEGLELSRVRLPKSEPNCGRCLDIDGAAVAAVLRARPVVVHALFVLAEHLVLRSHPGDAPDHYLQLTHRHVLLSVLEDSRFFFSLPSETRPCVFFGRCPVGIETTSSVRL